MQKKARSHDGLEISYQQSGRGPEALVFVHGWLGNGLWWDEQRQAFEPRYQIVQLDLAGHGRSAHQRNVWSIEGYAEDIKAVVEDAGLEACHLIGHSMSGSNVIAAALLLGPKVRSIVLVDTLLDLDAMPGMADVQPMLDGLRMDYDSTMEQALARFLLVPDSPPAVRARLKREMLAIGAEHAIAVLEPFYRSDIRPRASQVQVPVRAINADMWPTNAAANRKYLRDFDFKIIQGAGHYPMLEKPSEFNQALQDILLAL